MKKEYVIAFWIAVALPVASAANERAADPNTPPVAVARLKWTKIRGHVKSINPTRKTLEISDLDGNITAVTVNKNVQILRSYRVVEFETLKPEDRVELRYVGL